MRDPILRALKRKISSEVAEEDEQLRKELSEKVAAAQAEAAAAEAVDAAHAAPKKSKAGGNQGVRARHTPRCHHIACVVACHFVHLDAIVIFLRPSLLSSPRTGRVKREKGCRRRAAEEEGKGTGSRRAGKGRKGGFQTAGARAIRTTGRTGGSTV